MSKRLIEIGSDGLPVESLPLCNVALSVCAATRVVYLKTGFVPPWVGYLAVDCEQVVGTCAFKSPPKNGRVEIAYFTFAEYEGLGVATWMAQQLVELAREEDGAVIITAQTLPNENASTAILHKLQFCRSGIAHDDEVGEVWEWKLSSERPH